MLPTAGAAAQDFGGYVTGGSGSIDYAVHRETIPQATVGVLWRAANDRLRPGGDVDVMTSNGHVAGRGGPFGEVALFRAGRAQPLPAAASSPAMTVRGWWAPASISG